MVVIMASKITETDVSRIHLRRDACDSGHMKMIGVGGNGAVNETGDPGWARECSQLGCQNV